MISHELWLILTLLFTPISLIQVHNLSKKFSTGLKRSQFLAVRYLLYDLINSKGEAKKLRKSEFWALRNINFEVKKGEILGIIGTNGSGKTTLLRLIAGLFKPTEGHILREGRVSTIFAGTSGMDPLLSGRENVYVRAAILGIQRHDVDEKLDEIIAFSELEDFIDAPLGTYSSGMRARLAFAVNISFPADIFIIDEGLAVGDRIFKKKCVNKLKEIASETIILSVTHSPFIIKSLCTRIIVLKKGEMVGDTTDIAEGLDLYLGTGNNTYASKINEAWSIDCSQEDHFKLNSIELEIHPEYGPRLLLDYNASNQEKKAKLVLNLSYPLGDRDSEKVEFELTLENGNHREAIIEMTDEMLEGNPKLSARVRIKGNVFAVAKSNYQVIS